VGMAFSAPLFGGPAAPSSRASVSTSAFAEKLKKLDTSQQSITALSHYMMHQANGAGASGGGRAGVSACVKGIVVEWLKHMTSGIPDTFLALIYLANELLQSTKRQSSDAGEALFVTQHPSKCKPRILLQAIASCKLLVR
jgi:hypothetical protein